MEHLKKKRRATSMSGDFDGKGLAGAAHLSDRSCGIGVWPGCIGAAILAAYRRGGDSACGAAFDPFVLQLLWALINAFPYDGCDLAGAILGIELMVFQGLTAFPCCDSSRSPCSTASLYLSVWARFRLPRPPSSRHGGAVNAGGRAGSSGNKRKIVGGRRGCSGLGRRANMIVDPPWDSPISLGGVPNVKTSLSSS